MLDKLLIASLPLFTAWTAFGQDAAPAPKGPSMIELLLMPIGFFLIMYFFIVRPQQRKAREHQELLAGLKQGDEIVTSGGIIGRVRSVADGFVTIDVGGGVSLKVLKGNVAALAKQQAKPAKEPAGAKA